MVPVLIVLICFLSVLLGRTLQNRWTPRPTELLPNVARQIDLNRADASELAQVSGLGPVRAEAILAHRSLYGSFDSPDSLDQVPGVGPATLAKVSGDFNSAEPDRLERKSVTIPPTPVRMGKIQPGEPRINVNSASQTELMRLPGIGPSLSQRIVVARGEEPFRTVEDLRRVKGIGQKTLENLRPLIVCE